MTKSFDAFVAGRYLRAKRKQAFIGVISLITLLGIALGVAALNIALSIHNGMQSAFLTSLVGYDGELYLVSTRPGGRGYTSGDMQDIGKTLQSIRGLHAMSPMREEQGVIFSGRKRLHYAKLQGIDPEAHMRATNKFDTMLSGDPAALLQRGPQDAPGIVLGADLAESLGVRLNDSVRIAVPRLASPGLSSRQGMKLKQLYCQVVGIFRTGNSQFDQTDAYLLLPDLLGLMGTDEVRSILISFNDLKSMEAAKQRLIEEPGLPLMTAVVDMRDLNSGLLQALKMEKLASTAVISLFILIVALNMVSALIMLVMEKHRDIGIMKSFGAPRKTILRIFLRQGMTLSLWGTLFGTLLGVTIAWLADHFELLKMDNQVYEVLNYLPFQIHPSEVLLVALGSLVLSFLSAVYPAFKAANLDPVQALKYD